MVQEIDCGIIMASIPMQAHKPVQVCSVQTLARRQQLPPADYYIFDEGHHAQMDNMWGKQIKQAVNNGAKILLVTATPYRLSGDGFEYLHDYKKTRLILGKSLKWLQDEGWLFPLRYLVASVADLSKVRLKAGEYDEEEAAEIMQLAPIVESYLEHVPGKTGICFTVNVRHSISTVSKYLHYGVPAAHIDANTPNDERQKIIS
jgi:DNA repair protein RadD